MKTTTKSFCAAFALLTCVALVRTAEAVVPPPDGGYPGFTTAEGSSALQNLTIGVGNTAAGWHSLFANSAGNLNTATGAGTLLFNTADNNTATGALALLSNTTGVSNTANGAFALFSNTTGFRNTANGGEALFSNTTGAGNTATGYFALNANTTGEDGTATGDSALLSNTTGFGNTATGVNALLFNTTGDRNTAHGRVALQMNTIGRLNTASGNGALFVNTTGIANTADGSAALFNNATGNFNIAVGEAAGQDVTSDNNIDIGNPGVTGESNTIRIGTVVPFTDPQGLVHPIHSFTYIAGISGQTATDGVAVYVNSDGKLGTLTSSARFKTEIKPMDQASEAVLALKPVTFRYKDETDPKKIPQFGLVAEEVEKVNPDLVARDADGKPYTVRYEAVNAMLLNEFLKEHRKIQKQEAAIAELKSTVAQQQRDFQATTTYQQKQIEALTVELQKVSAQIEVSRPASQVVDNRQ